jgi:hypothetical protein
VEAAIVRVLVDALRIDRRQQLDAKAAALLGEAVREVGAGDAFGEARVVVEALGDAGLAAEAAAFVGSESTEPSSKKIVGMMCLPPFASSTMRWPSASSSTSTNS